MNPTYKEINSLKHKLEKLSFNLSLNLRIMEKGSRNARIDGYIEATKDINNVLKELLK